MRTECKADGCVDPPEDRYGKYAGLCPKHKALEQTRQRTAGQPGREGAAAAVAKLVAPAKALDKAKTKIKGLPDRARLKAAFDEATRRAQQTPSAENLERVQETAKALGRGAPQREKLERELAYAESAMRDALTQLYRDMRDHVPRSGGDE